MHTINIIDSILLINIIDRVKFA